MFRYASWFTSESGRRFTHWCVGTTAVAIFGNQIAAYGPLLDRLKEIFQLYKDGKPRPLAPKMEKIVKEVLHDISLKEVKKKKLKFFYVVGHELLHAGGIDSPWGAIIGIPFTFEDMKDVNLGELRIVGKESIDWVIDGQDLIKAMNITDDAKKFALMREIYSCSFSDILINAAIGTGCFITSASFAKNMNARSNALEKLTFGQRSIRYSIIFCLGFVFYRLLKDPLKHISDRTADKLAAETGINYLNGGIEFYKKTLEKNKAFREIADSRFQRIYDEQGNENYLVLAPKLPISKRLEYLQIMKKEKVGNIENVSA